ncbi:MAG: HlyD family type I secretion periplasmic adaptor subunit [Prochlorococcaceae cyanobacterium]|jgi:adhesin transport system membrane fusion protein
MASTLPESPTPPRQDPWSLGDAQDRQELIGPGRLAESLSLEAGQVPLNLRNWLLGGTAVLAGSLVVAALVPIQDYVVASGEIEPAGEIQKVQHLEGGVIASVPVREGERVRKGQVLMKLDEGQLGTREQQTATRITNLMLEQQELRSALGQPVVGTTRLPSRPSPDVRAAFHDLRDAKQNRILREIRQAEKRIATLDAKKREYLDEVALLRQQVRAYESLDSAGAIAHVDVLEAERRIASTETQLAELDGTRAEAVEALHQLRANLQMETYARLAQVNAEKAELQSTLRREISEVERLQVRSPVDGIVKNFVVKVEGGVVAPGSVVAEVVPVGQRLLAFVRVKPSDIGNVSMGQKVQLKVQAFDYSRYGTLPGRVESISAGTFNDEKTGEPYYKVRVSLDRDYAGRTPGRNLLTPGMTLTADILTDRTNLLLYLLGPIRRGFGDAFHERA